MALRVLSNSCLISSESYSISPIDIAVSAFFLPKKISPIPQIAKLKISMPNKTFIKMDVTLERINCSMLNPIHRKMWHLNQEILSRPHIKRVGGFTATRISFKPKIKNKKQKRKKVLVSLKKSFFMKC